MFSTLFAKIGRIAAALALLAATSVAGESCVSGSSCANGCPLAQTANARFATGTESVAVSKTIRADVVKTVLANLEAI